MIGAILLVSGCIGGNGGSGTTPTADVDVTHVPTINHPATSTPDAAASSGPTSYFTINGTVYGSSGIAEANAIVTLWQNNKKVAIDGVTNPQFSGDGTTAPLGQYTFKNLPKATYMITADKDGYEKTIFYDGYTYIGSDLWLTDKATATKLAGATVNTGGYVSSFKIERQSNGDVVITNEGGLDSDFIQSVAITYTDASANTIGPKTISNLQSNGVTGSLLHSGETCTIPKAAIATYSHVVVSAVFSKPPADVTSLLPMSVADV